jgi:DNA invertase Pin-like site-specific DNA recombinase
MSRVREPRTARYVGDTAWDIAAVGYARISTRGQNLDGQIDARETAGCKKVFVEHASGVLAKQPALQDALDYPRAGDTLVVTSLDRLGRYVRNLKEVVDGLEKRDLGLKTPSQGTDTTTPGGRLRSPFRPAS